MSWHEAVIVETVMTCNIHTLSQTYKYTMNIPDVPMQVEVDPNEDTEWYLSKSSTDGMK